MDNKVDLFKALADENRLRILSMLRVRNLCVCEINAILNVAMSTISSHLKILRNSGLVSSTKDGRWIIYSLNKSDEEINNLLDTALNYIADQEKIKEDTKQLNHVSPETCKPSA
jgi:ArsR family transcriptional regulator